MKYDITHQNSCIHLKVLCSGCGAHLSGKEKFCPECGRKLRVLKTEITTEDILDLMEMERPEGTDVDADTSNFQPNASKKTTDKGQCQCKFCMFQRTDKTGCNLYRNGYCIGTIYPTYPPQYKRCDFEGDDFKFCQDVPLAREDF